MALLVSKTFTIYSNEKGDRLVDASTLSATRNTEARDTVCALTGSNDGGLVAFGTEAGFLQALGAEAVVCGPRSIEQAHKADEFVAVEQMRACFGMLVGLGGGVLG